MRVWLEVGAVVRGTIPVAVPYPGPSPVTVEHDVLLRKTGKLLLELEVTNEGDVTHAWLGPEGKLETLPLGLVGVFTGADSVELRASLLLMRENHTTRVIANAVAGVTLNADGDQVHPESIGDALRQAGVALERETGARVVVLPTQSAGGAP